MSEDTIERDDGRFYAKHREIWRRPLERLIDADTGRKSISIGFPVCTLHDCMPDEAAEIICRALNHAEHGDPLEKPDASGEAP